MWNLVISKPENHILRRKTTIKIEFDFNRKRKHSSISYNRQQVGQIKKKIGAKFNKSLFILISNTLKSQNDHKLSSRSAR